MRRLWFSVSLIAVALGATSSVAFGAHSAAAQSEVLGFNNGALYALFFPSSWNGRLAVYAHGFVDPDAELALPDVAPVEVAPWVVGLREALLSSGYAVAYSSYSENGWAVGDGALRTRELSSLFTNHFGAPFRTYLIGRSLGGLTTLMLAENYASDYGGALTLCAPVGGGLRQTDYVGHARVLFDFFFPGVIPGDAVNVPPLDYANDSPLVQTIVGAILANPQAAMSLAAVDQVELPYTTFSELINSIVRVLGYNVRGTNDLLARTGGASPYDNTGVTYKGLGTFDATLNAGLDRYAGQQAGRDYLQRFYQSEGRLRRPLLTLHTTLDPDVPFAHQQALADVVAQARNSKWLVQQHYVRYGHCTFSTAETVRAFTQLVQWAETGVKPPSGALTEGSGGTTEPVNPKKRPR